MLKKMPISYRLMLFVPILLLSLVTIVWFGLSELRSRLIDDRRDSLKSLVEVAHHVVDGWYQKEKSGALSREQAVDVIYHRSTMQARTEGAGKSEGNAELAV